MHCKDSYKNGSDIEELRTLHIAILIQWEFLIKTPLGQDRILLLEDVLISGVNKNGINNFGDCMGVLVISRCPYFSVSC